MILSINIDFSRIFEGENIAIAGTGMLIVFAALLLITTFISALPRILKVVEAVLPETPDRHTTGDHSESLLPDEAVLAAIGFVLHTELRKQVDSTGPKS